MSTLSLKKARTELVMFVRNSDVFSTTQRSVTTASDTGTFSATSTYNLVHTGVKNVRSVVVASVTLKLGKDYDVDLLFSSTLTRITFLSAQTGAYTITYDYGTDKIFGDWARSDLTISSFPRISCDVIDIPKNPEGFTGNSGAVNEAVTNSTIIIYADKRDDIATYIDTLDAAVFTNQKNFYYLGKYMRTVSIGACVPSPREQGKDKIFQQPIDIRGRFFYEK